MVEEEFSPGVADSVICGAALENDGAYTSVGDYDPKELAALVNSLNALAGLDRGKIFRRFGRHMFWHHWIERPHWFRNVQDVFTFAARYDELLADDIGTLYERTAPKRISVVCESASNGMAIVAYSRPLRHQERASACLVCAGFSAMMGAWSSASAPGFP